MSPTIRPLLISLSTENHGQVVSSGKGLRAITHATVNIALLEYCQANGLSHP